MAYEGDPGSALATSSRQPYLQRGFIDPPDDPVGVGFQDLALALRRHWLTVVAITGATVAVVLAATMAAHMRFTAHGSLYLGELQGSKTQAVQSDLTDQLDVVGDRNSDVATEVEILRSRDLVNAAALDAGLTSDFVPADWKEPRYLSWRLSRRDLRILDANRHVRAIRALLGEGPRNKQYFDVSFSTGGKYEIRRGGQTIGSGTLGTEFKSPALSLTLLEGPEGAPPAGAIYTLQVRSLEDVDEELDAHLSIAVPKLPNAGMSTDLIRVASIDYNDASPQRAADFIDKLMKGFLERRQSWKSEETTAAESFLDGQIRTVRESLDDAERTLADYRKNSAVVVLGDESQGFIDQARQYDQQRVTAKLQLESFSQIERGMSKGGATTEKFLVGEADDPVLASLSQALAQAQQQLKLVESRFTEAAPQVQEQRDQVATQLRMLQNYVSSRRVRAQKQLDSLDSMIGKFETKLKSVPKAELQLAQLTRNVDVLAKMYTFLMERKQAAAVGKASTISRNRILDSPVLPRREESPRLGLRIAGGGFAGLLLGLLVVLIRALVSGTYQSERQLTSFLPIPSVIGFVPRRALTRAGRRGNSSLSSLRRIDLLTESSPTAFNEAFRHLRTSLYQWPRRTGEHDKVLLITSPSPGDGKTLCTLSLAAAMATDRKRVLVIEADMHRPVHHYYYRQSRRPGLADMQQRSDLIRTVQAEGVTFDAITAGANPQHAAELLSSEAFSALIADSRRHYDFILIDSPPYPAVADALIMVEHADRVISVVRLNHTRKAAASEHFRRMSSLARKYSIILNGVDRLGYPYSGAKHYGAAVATGTWPANDDLGPQVADTSQR